MWQKITVFNDKIQSTVWLFVLFKTPLLFNLFIHSFPLNSITQPQLPFSHILMCLMTSFDRYGEMDGLLALTLGINLGETMGFQGITANHNNPLSRYKVVLNF